MRASPRFPLALVCKDCQAIVPRRSAVQRYCIDCSSKRDVARKRQWANGHPQLTKPGRYEQTKSRIVQRGIARSRTNVANITWPADASDLNEVRQSVRVAVPFDYAASKNAVWRTGRGGHVYARQEATAFRQNLAMHLRSTRGSWFEGRVWIDIFVEKPDQRGDAINFVDVVCDAVKDAIGVDDRWFCLRRVDWSIVKSGPLIYVGVSQAVTEHHRACSYCGHILPLASGFTRNRSGPLGFSRACHSCSSAKRRLVRPTGTQAIALTIEGECDADD